MTTRLYSFPSQPGTGGGSAVFTGALVASSPVAAIRAQFHTMLQTGFETSEGYHTTIQNPVSVVSDSGIVANFTPTSGALYGQGPFANFFTPPIHSAAQLQNAINSTTIVSTSAASGRQSVQIVGATLGNQSILWSGAENLVAGACGVLNVAVDLRVTRPSAAYGHWGLSLLANTDQGFGTVATLGTLQGSVIASNDGTSRYAALDPLTGQVYKASYGTYSNYVLQLNFDTRTISGFYNGTQVAFLPIDRSGNPIGEPVQDMPFATGFTNKTISYATFGEALNNTKENATFDNFRVFGTDIQTLSTAAPETGTLVPLQLGLCQVSRHK